VDDRADRSARCPRRHARPRARGDAAQQAQGAVAHAAGYVWIFRGTPLLVQLIIIYTGLPQLGLVRFTVLESAVLGLALNEAAYLSEILRGGILSVAKGQTEAARALGLKPFQIFRWSCCRRRCGSSSRRSATR
jgi:ABC-type amino acid transport system permease subunit